MSTERLTETQRPGREAAGYDVTRPTSRATGMSALADFGLRRASGARYEVLESYSLWCHGEG